MIQQLKTKLIALITLLVMSSLHVLSQVPRANIEQKVNNLLKKLTLAEKINMIHASSSFTSGSVERLGIPELTMSDGPHGVRPEHGRGWDLLNNGKDSSTYLPVGSTLASTWNPALGYASGAVLGSEAKYRGKDVILGPGINIMRTPLNGRNFEYMSEDPYLISQMAVGYIKGVQDQGISACVKHFAANNQEIRRNGINVEMSERALREIYLPGFKAAVTVGGVNTLMGAYNRFRGEYCSYNDYLINQILKKEWGFKGIVISDWGAVHSTKEALLGGLDLEMGTDLAPASRKYEDFYMGRPAYDLFKSGAIDEAVLDDKVRRILRVMFKTNMIGAHRTAASYATAAHAATAKKIAEEAIILLKNDEHLLPLINKNRQSIAVIGAAAVRKNAMDGGSSQVLPKYEITPLQGLKNILNGNAQISFSPGYTVALNGTADQHLIADAVKAAKAAETPIIFGGWVHGYGHDKWEDNAFDAEDFDKKDMHMPFGQDELITAVLDANPNTVVVLFGGGAMDITKWVHKAKAIVLAGYPGQEGGNALAEILMGTVNPSGKLTYTWPKNLEDAPAHKIGEYPGDSLTVRYKDDIFVGYRYFDTYKVEPQFAFGHGLSYTSFKYSNIKAVHKGNKVSVSFIIQNTGRISGAEVAQVYVREEKPKVKRPEKELKSFRKILIRPGQSTLVQLDLPQEAFEYYDDTHRHWTMQPGMFDILVGTASDAISLQTKLNLK